MKALAVDLGSRRVGLATSDPGGLLASPFQVLDQTGDPKEVHQRIAAIVEAEKVEVVVVGLPLSLDGTSGPAALAARAEAHRLAALLPVPVVLHDERFTTVTANRLLAARGTGGRARRKMIDSAAAAVLLQAWLDGGAPRTNLVDPSDPLEDHD